MHELALWRNISLKTRRLRQLITYEIAICHTPLIHNFIKERQKLERSMIDQLKHVMF